MAFFKTRELISKETVAVGTTSSLIVSESTDLKYNFTWIQNTGNDPVYLSLGEVATAGTDGELLLAAGDRVELPFQGNIYAICPATATTNPCSVIIF